MIKSFLSLAKNRRTSRLLQTNSINRGLVTYSSNRRMFSTTENEDVERDVLDYDVLVVGGGPAGNHNHI